MIDYFVAQIETLMRMAREEYGVDPVVFLVIYLASAPIFYYSLFRMARALAKKLGGEIMLWSTVFLASVVAPFVYVLLFGRNLPWWVYAIIAVLVGQGVISLIRNLRKKPEGPGREGAQPGA
jgi:hypothetical protein